MMNYCPECGEKLEIATKFCSNCGKKLGDAGKAQIVEPEPIKVEEQHTNNTIVEKADPTFYVDSRGVRVTSTRLIIPAKNPNEGPATYSMANITSIKTEKQDPNRSAPILLALLSVLAIWGGIYWNSNTIGIVGFVSLVISIFWLILDKPTYHLKIASASGETDALRPEHDRQYVDKVVSAINEALIKRG